jgi:hypothetical protein
MNANEAMVAPMGESATGGSLESGGWSYVGAFGRNLASVAVKTSSHDIQFITKFYKSCYFQYDLLRKFHNKLFYCSTQTMLIPVKFDGSQYAKKRHKEAI